MFTSDWVWSRCPYGDLCFGKIRQIRGGSPCLPKGEPACWLIRLQVHTHPGGCAARLAKPKGAFLLEGTPYPDPSHVTAPCPAIPALPQGRCLSREGFCVPRLQDGWNGKHRENVENKQVSWQEECYGLQKAAELEKPQLQQARDLFPPGWRRARFSVACILSGHAINTFMFVK